MGVQWTKEQNQVITLRNRNILVSAAAGSGKTAVLVERIIQMLTNRVDPMDVDRLLIVTFTEAAAAEMKERIRNAIEKKLEEYPGDVHLQRQATLIHSAKIMTIHSFCMSVIREHFHVINLDPGFRTGDEGELKLLKQDVIEEVLENCYAESSDEFLDFVEMFGSGKTDKKLEELVVSLYEYSRSYPQPERWLANCVEWYTRCREAYQEGKEFEDTEMIQQAMYWIRVSLEDLLKFAQFMVKICMEPDGPHLYMDAVESDVESLEDLIACDTYSAMFERFATLKWTALSRKKDETISKEKRELVKALRDQLKGSVNELKEMFFYDAPLELYKDMIQSEQPMKVLVNLVCQFGELFTAKKRAKHMIDFEDMEHYALQILTEEKDGELVPSATAREYQEQFIEVMIDEYQDSNLIQEAILTSVSTVSQSKYNIFMVGDVKQSIYRFRLSRPELFMEKYHTYSEEESVTQRIDLHKNFRSRAEVLDSINFIFKKIMHQELGGIEYDDKVALYPGAKFEQPDESCGQFPYKTEALLINDENVKEVKGEDAMQLEIRIIAKRIKELMRTLQVTDKATGGFRKLQYRDIVILMRSPRGWEEAYTTIFAEEGIPIHIGSSEGYFETYEVSVLLDYLQLLDNQKQDLPLTAVLTSPFAGFQAEELAQIRLKAKERFFYESAEEMARRNETELEKKLHAFYKKLNAYRDILPYTAIHDLLWKIIEETGYGLYIAAMPGGEQRLANIEMLIEKACAFESTSYKGLFNFVRYIEQLKKYDVDYGEANIIDEQSDTVRLMTIHKSKGLEFPVVFVAGMGKKFNIQDITGNMIIHPELGVGLDAINLERRTKAPTFMKKIIQNQVHLENLGEELRVLYVALTRAKEKLIMVGRIGKENRKTLEDVMINGASLVDKYVRIGYIELCSAINYMSWVFPAILDAQAPISIHLCGIEQLEEQEYIEQRTELLAKDVLENWDAKKVYDEELRAHLQELAAYQYPYMEEQKLKLKFTVSELKKRAYLEEEGGENPFDEEQLVPVIPNFIQEDEEVLKGASRGSAYHKLLELLDFEVDYTDELLKQKIDHLKAEGMLSEEMANCIYRKDILQFLHSDAGKRMTLAARAKLLSKEQPFVLAVDAKEIYPETKSEEMILVQGIIDVFFEEDGELVVLDYKTDRVKHASELCERYQAQLDYYAQALEQLLQKKVKEKIIYSFTLKEEIKL